MMAQGMKQLFIIIIFYLSTGGVFAQTAAEAILSATIVNSVGIEKTENIEVGDFLVNGRNSIEVNQAFGKINLKKDVGSVMMLQIIGSSCMYDISVNGSSSIIREYENIALNIFTMPAILKKDNPDYIMHPIALIVSLSRQQKISARLPFIVTVNFN